MKILLLVLGLIIGAGAGWFTAPKPAAQMEIGPVSVEVDKDGDGGSVTATGGDGNSLEIAVGEQSMLDDRNTRTGIFAAGGGIIGLLLGFVFGRSRPT
ncbi:MAG: hypothetical protein GY953_03710 [bacterium]|nr:hypothetical protein [bacterium]